MTTEKEIHLFNEAKKYSEGLPKKDRSAERTIGFYDCIVRCKPLIAELEVMKESIQKLFDQIEKYEPHAYYIISQWDEYINVKNNL